MQITKEDNLVRFSTSDIDEYAKFSGDINPFHMSEEYAKLNNQPGRVVHGAFIVTEILERIQKVIDFTTKISCDFMLPIVVEVVHQIEIKVATNKFEILITKHNVTYFRMILSPQDNLRKPDEYGQLLSLEKPQNGYSLPKNLVSNLARCSHFVGMINPGELAILRRIEIQKISQEYTTIPNIFSNYNRDFYSVLTNTVGEFQCITYSMRRSYDDLGKINDEIQLHFKNKQKIRKKAVVVGSTGALGSQISLLLMYLGFEVIGINREVNVKVKELKRIASLHNYNFLNLPISNLERDITEYKLIGTLREINLFAYCSSPFIVKNFEVFNENLYNEYIDIYVNQFQKYFRTFPSHMNLFVPSTQLLNQTVNTKANYSEGTRKSYIEYILAKKKQEQSAIEITNQKNLNLFMPRLPAFKSRHHNLIDVLHGESLITFNPNLVQFANWIFSIRQ